MERFRKNQTQFIALDHKHYGVACRGGITLHPHFAVTGGAVLGVMRLEKGSVMG